MRVLVAPDCFTGTLTAAQAAAAVAAGWRRVAANDELVEVPLSDGGPGFLAALGASLGSAPDARWLPVRVPGPVGSPVDAEILLVTAQDGVPTGYLESAGACGSHLVPPPARDPGATSSRGVGVLLAAARRAGARRIVVGLGGSGTNDAGAGLLAALVEDVLADEAPARDTPHRHAPPARSLPVESLPGESSTAMSLPVESLAAGRCLPTLARLAAGGDSLAGIRAEDLTDAGPALRRLRERWAGVEIVVASDVDVPLHGPDGASLAFSAQKGASPGQAERLEGALADFASAVTRVLDAPADLADRPGAGAAGGLGFGLFLLGGRRVPGVLTVAEAVGLRDLLRGCDLVITGEGRFDRQSLRGKVVSGVAHLAGETGTPVILLAGQVAGDRTSPAGPPAPGTRRSSGPPGRVAVHAVAMTPAEVAASLADPAGWLTAAAARLAAEWAATRSPW